MAVNDSGQCGGCPIGGATGRRAFLRDALGGAVLVFTSLGVFADAAAALPLSVITGSGARADKRYPLPATDGAAIDKDESVIISRTAGRVYAFSLACPHQNTAIRWEPENHRFQCPKHHSKYRPDGTFIEGRATRGLDRFAVRGDGDAVVVNLDALYRQDQDAAPWASAFIEVATPEK